MILSRYSAIKSFQTLAMAALFSPVMALADSDSGITMRMVVDEEALDSTFVQELELPKSVNELGYGESTGDLDARELSSEARTLEESLSAQARENRDALELELPGESTPLSPELDTPPLEPLDPALPGDNLDLLDGTDSTLNGITSQ
ncbi:MAG TPA: hypothetical protein VFN01_02255 [Marinobacter sp.]|uniref:hypothetical protein n=1 Tax=Marinobacter sp. TaxID=50741 RepID=UPI002604B9F7|nr:hypothetical protein [Marinobacter sp.]HET8799982.1 hypothetical protein [Marinobacter sp.]